MKIFINYRRQDSADVTDRIHENLIVPLGPFNPDEIFRDVTGIPSGTLFEKILEEEMAKSSICVVIIGSEWIGMRDEHGNLRLHAADDYVRREIEMALARRIPVLPILINDTKMPDEADLPKSIVALRRWQSATIRPDPDFKTDMAGIVVTLNDLLKPPPALSPIRTDTHGVEQVFVLAGTFIMGSNPKHDADAQDNEQPTHEVQITHSYWLDQFPVTNAMYADFLNDGGYQNQNLWPLEGWVWRERENILAPEDYKGFLYPNQPRVGISWFEAAAYAKWRGGCLPTEAEWEYAARGPQSRIYPWGDEYDPDRCNTERRHARTTPVDAYPNGRSWVGAYDMTGNVLEWAADWYNSASYNSNLHQNPPGAPSGSSRVARGGAWDYYTIYARAAARDNQSPLLRRNNLGLRVMSLSPSEKSESL